MSLLIATSNRGKIKEIKKLLGKEIPTLTPLDPQAVEACPRPPSVEENGSTYYENVLTKALRYHEAYQMPVLADDSGLEVDCLGGAPGVYAAVYGGEKLSMAQRWAHLLGEIRKSAAAQPWTARFRCVLCYYDGRNVPWFSEGSCEGRILPEPVGAEGFGYDPLFWSKDLDAGFGTASEESKNQISHRARALQKFLRDYKSRGL